MELHYRRSLASRISALTTVAVGVSVAVVAIAAYFTVRHQLLVSLDHSLYKRATYAASTPAVNELALQQVPPWVVGAADLKVLLVTADGQTVFTESPVKGDRLRIGKAEIAVARGKRSYAFRTVATPKTDYRIVSVPSSDPGVALVLAQSLEPDEDTLSRLGLVLLLFGAAGVVAAAAAGWGVARNGLRPVRQLTFAAEQIARTEQLDPIPVEGDDEIGRLATAFNKMLVALSASRDRQRQLVADAGHELRTPLTSLRTNLDLLLQAESRGGLSEQSRLELMGDVRFQIEELTTLIGDLTELAREDRPQVELEKLDLAEVVERAVQRVRRRASGLEFDVHLQPWWVDGDSAALERAVLNLLDNAVKWSPPLGTVRVHLRAGTLLVTDQGHGIAEADLPHVFDRFYRSPESRTMPGSGLGLSIVRQIAERHGGNVHAGRSREGGAAFWLTVPGTEETPATG